MSTAPPLPALTQPAAIDVAPAPPVERRLASPLAREPARPVETPALAPAPAAAPVRLPAMPSSRLNELAAPLPPVAAPVPAPPTPLSPPSPTPEPTPAPLRQFTPAAPPVQAPVAPLPASPAAVAAPAPLPRITAPDAAPLAPATTTAAPLSSTNPGAADAGARVGHDLATPPSAPASAPLPRLNLDLPRMRGGELSRGMGQGALQLLPRPPELPDPKLARDIERSGKADCRTAHANLGLLAVVPLAADAVRKDGCKW